MFKHLAFLFLALSLSLTACGGNAESLTNTGNAESGEDLFMQPVIGSAPGCTTCHSLEENKVIVGPSLAGFANHAKMHADAVGKSVEAYAHESIINPNAYLVEGFAPNLMPQNFGSDLTPEQINDLVAFLSTLKGGENHE